MPHFKPIARLLLFVAISLNTACGVGKDKYSGMTCQELKSVEITEKVQADRFTQEFQRNPTSQNETSMMEAQANVAYAQDVQRDKKCVSI